jgi:eukaryotic-like serine/threonine-protein kinase
MTWKLPGYVADELLGFGGSGEVWRGHATSTGASVALKRLPVGDAAQVQAARGEAALLSTLDHPHLIRLHELVPAGDAVVLVLDLAGGGSLTDLLSRRGRLTPGEVITALAPIGAALAYAHNEGVAHGDVTPANILFTDEGLPLLADLGVARIVGDAAPARSTPGYVDPSVAAGCVPGAPSDVFMLAAVAVHALTGSPLWTGATPADMIARAAAGDVGDLASRLAALPPAMAALLERALSIEPHLRCGASEFALDLRHSGEPAPVELAAGGAGLGHAAVEGPDVPLAGADPARPAFTRPGDDPPLSNPAQLTHGVRAALHRRVRRGHRRRWPIVAVAGASLIGVALVAGLRSVGHHATAHQPTPPPVTSAEPSPEDRALAIVRGLDVMREQAFARRRASLLRQVYVPGPLLTKDSALLLQIVPAGCELVGVRTTYSALQVIPASGRLVLAATVTLAPSTLTCHAAVMGRAAGEAPTRLRIELVPAADGYRIASQQRV